MRQIVTYCRQASFSLKHVSRKPFANAREKNLRFFLVFVRSLHRCRPCLPQRRPQTSPDGAVDFAKPDTAGIINDESHRHAQSRAFGRKSPSWIFFFNAKTMRFTTCVHRTTFAIRRQTLANSRSQIHQALRIRTDQIRTRQFLTSPRLKHLFKRRLSDATFNQKNPRKYALDVSVDHRMCCLRASKCSHSRSSARPNARQTQQPVKISWKNAVKVMDDVLRSLP